MGEESKKAFDQESVHSSESGYLHNLTREGLTHSRQCLVEESVSIVSTATASLIFKVQRRVFQCLVGDVKSGGCLRSCGAW